MCIRDRGTTPRQKRDRIIALGQGRVELIVGGDTYDDAYAACRADAAATGAVIVPAFDHVDTCLLYTSRCV